MKRIRIVGLCLVAAFAMSAVAASTAAAEPPEIGRCLKKAVAGGAGFSDAGCTKAVASAAKYEWQAGPGPKNKFTSKMKEATSATLETVKLEKITCKGETSTGEIASAKEVAAVVATFTECTSSGLKCTSAGQAEGTIVTNPLSGVVGDETESAESEAKDKVAEELHGPGGGNLAEFSCAGIPIVVKGSVLHNISANKMLNPSTEKFTASKGEQKPDKFVGGPVDQHILESNKGGGEFLEAGQTITAIVTYEEKYETSSVN